MIKIVKLANVGARSSFDYLPYVHGKAISIQQNTVPSMNDCVECASNFNSISNSSYRVLFIYCLAATEGTIVTKCRSRLAPYFLFRFILFSIKTLKVLAFAAYLTKTAALQRSVSTHGWDMEVATPRHASYGISSLPSSGEGAHGFRCRRTHDTVQILRPGIRAAVTCDS